MRAAAAIASLLMVVHYTDSLCPPLKTPAPECPKINDFLLCVFSVAITHEKVKDDDANVEEAVRENDITWVEDGNGTDTSPTDAEADDLLDQLTAGATSFLESQQQNRMTLECKMRAAILRQHVMYWGDENYGKRLWGAQEDDGSCKQARDLIRATKCTMVANCPTIACTKAGFKIDANASKPYKGPEVAVFDVPKNISEINATKEEEEPTAAEMEAAKGPAPPDVALVIQQEADERQRMTPWMRDYKADYNAVELKPNEKLFGNKEPVAYNPGPPPQEIYCEMKRQNMQAFNLAPWEHMDDPDCVVGA